MSSHLRVLPVVFTLLVSAPVLAAPAADSDWFASLYTGDGAELRADERVFTLYALLNAMGYDDAPISRQNPLPKRAFHPVRTLVRQKVLATPPELRKQADAFFDSHPAPLGRYLAYTVHSAAPPFASGAKAKELADLKGFETLLANVYTQWSLQDLMGQVQSEYRKGLKGYLTAIDAPLTKARKLLKVPENGPQTLVVLNLLEAQNEVKGVMGEGEVVVIAGPAEKPNIEGVVREFGRVLVDPQVAKKAQASWSGGNALLREAQLLGAGEKTVGDYATALVARALALRSMDATDSAYESAAQQGYFGLKEISKGFDDGRQVEAWALDALARAETRRPSKR
ncbi:MAG: hypothetical protein ACT4TC_05415 [Myxococcaceae bacterium]